MSSHDSRAATGVLGGTGELTLLSSACFNITIEHGMRDNLYNLKKYTSAAADWLRIAFEG